MNEHFVLFGPFLEKTLPLRMIHVGKSRCDAGFYYARRSSNVIAFEYIISGTGVFHINGHRYEPGEDSIFVYTKGSNHEYYCPGDDAWVKYSVAFDGTLVDELLKAYVPNDVYVFEHTQAKALFTRMYAIAQDDALSYRERNDLLAAELFKVFLKLQRNRSSEQIDLADQMRSLMDQNLKRNYTLDQLSRDLNYSKNHLIHVFREKYKTTPYRYLETKRIELAKEYLTSMQYSVAEVAELLCYADSRYFCSCFKKAAGCTPGQYKKRFQAALSKNVDFPAQSFS